MPDSSYDVLWLQQKLNQQARGQALAVIEQTGRALPCTVTAVNGSLVTVKFEVTGPWTLSPLTLPKAESQWLRAPTQIGDTGYTAPADTFLGGISGQGTGLADLNTRYGNMTTLVWVPVAAISFVVTPDANKPWVNGPSGATISDTAQTTVTTNDTTTKTIAHTVFGAEGTGATTVEMILDGVHNKITHTLTNSAGTIYTIVDGAGNAISHVSPAGGLLGLGALASTLNSARAVPAQADLQTLSNNLLGTSIQSLMSIMSTAMISAGIPNAAAFEAIVSAAHWILDNISLPTIPGCSSIVRVIP